MDKRISFADGAGAVLNMGASTECKNLCRSPGDGSAILKYDVENNDTEEKKGDLTAWVGVYLSTSNYGRRDDATGQGILIDRSYTKKGSRDTADVTGAVTGAVKTKPAAPYYLNFVVDFDVSTEGRGLDATQYMYMGKIMPQELFLSRR
jgi:hypothetical protein